MGGARRATRAAELIWQAWRSGRRIAALPVDLRPGDPLMGMAAQLALERMAGSGYGWKIAATSSAGQAHIAVDSPLPGRLFERFRYAEGDELPRLGRRLRAGDIVSTGTTTVPVAIGAVVADFGDLGTVALNFAR